MANTYVDYTAVAAQTDYNFSFEYLRDEHVKVKVNGSEVTNFTIVTSPVQLIRFDTAPVAGAAIKIYRDSRGDFSPLVDFVDGSILTENELDESYKHNLFIGQEASEGQGGEQLTKKGLEHYDAEGNKIINLFAPSDATDAANKAYVDQTIDNAIALGGSPAIVSLGGYDVTATGSTTARSLEDRFGDYINVLYYGVKNDGTDHTTGDDNATRIQSIINTKKSVYFPKGEYKISTALNLDSVTIYGEGMDSTIIKPYDCKALIIDGTGLVGGYANYVTVRDLTIECDNITNAQTEAVLIKDSYRINFERVKIWQIPIGSGVDVGVRLSGKCLFNCFNNLAIVGNGSAGSFTNSCLYLNTTSDGQSKPTFFNLDAENATTAVYIDSDASTDVYNIYVERTNKGVYIKSSPTSSHPVDVNFMGGTMIIPYAGSSGFSFDGTFSNEESYNISNIQFGSPDKLTRNLAFVENVSFTWTNKSKISLTNINWDWISYSRILENAIAFYPNHPTATKELQNYKSIIQKTGIPDLTATDIFKLDGLNTGGVGAGKSGVFVTVKAFLDFNGYGKALEHSVFVIQDRSDQNAFICDKQVLASTVHNDVVSNFSVTSLEVSAIEDTDNIRFQVTVDFNTTVLTTVNPVFEVEVIGECDFTKL